MMGRPRLAYFVPVVAGETHTAGALAVDIGWVEDLVAPRNALREAIASGRC